MEGCSVCDRQGQPLTFEVFGVILFRARHLFLPLRVASFTGRSFEPQIGGMEGSERGGIIYG